MESSGRVFAPPRCDRDVVATTIAHDKGAGSTLVGPSGPLRRHPVRSCAAAPISCLLATLAVRFPGSSRRSFDGGCAAYIPLLEVRPHARSKGRCEAAQCVERDGGRCGGRRLRRVGSGNSEAETPMSYRILRSSGAQLSRWRPPMRHSSRRSRADSPVQGGREYAGGRDPRRRR